MMFSTSKADSLTGKGVHFRSNGVSACCISRHMTLCVSLWVDQISTEEEIDEELAMSESEDALQSDKPGKTNNLMQVEMRSHVP